MLKMTQVNDDLHGILEYLATNDHGLNTVNPKSDKMDDFQQDNFIVSYRLSLFLSLHGVCCNLRS